MAFLYYIAIFLASYLFTKHFLHKLQNLPPTPLLSLPIIGHLHLLKKPLHHTLSLISNRHGPILFLKFGSRPVLVITSPSLAEQCLANNDIVFANRPRLTIGQHLGYNYTHLAWAPYGKHWKNLRRICSLEILSTTRVQLLSSIRADEVKSMIRCLLKNHHHHHHVEMKTVFFELTLNVMMRMIAGKRYYGDDVADFEEARMFQGMVKEAHRLGGVTYIGDFLPFMRRMGFRQGMEEELIELHQKRDGFIQSLIEEHRRNIRSSGGFLSGGKRTMIEALLLLQESEPEYYKDEIIRGIMLVLLAGGIETSSNTLEWAVSLLLNHPEVLKKAQTEIDNCIGHDRLIDESDMARLPYLHSIITETLRMYPVVPLLIPHESSEDCMVGGYRIPRGTMLFVNVWAIQNDPKLWVDPTKFMPERFEGVEGMRDGFRLMPFGSGRRGCPGEGLALRMVGLALGSLIQCFEWERVGEEMVDMREGAGFTMPKAQPLHAKCRPRQPMINLLYQI